MATKKPLNKNCQLVIHYNYYIFVFVKMFSKFSCILISYMTLFLIQFLLQLFADSEVAFAQVLKLDKNCEDAMFELARVRVQQLEVNIITIISIIFITINVNTVSFSLRKWVFQIYKVRLQYISMVQYRLR